MGFRGEREEVKDDYLENFLNLLPENIAKIKELSDYDEKELL